MHDVLLWSLLRRLYGGKDLCGLLSSSSAPHALALPGHPSAVGVVPNQLLLIHSQASA